MHAMRSATLSTTAVDLLHNAVRLWLAHKGGEALLPWMAVCRTATFSSARPTATERMETYTTQTASRRSACHCASAAVDGPQWSLVAL